MNFSDILARRRAVNFFDTERDVPPALLEQMVHMAANAPSGFNLQPWNLIVLRGQEEKMRLRKVAMNQPKVSEAPVVFIVLADTKGWEKGHPTLERNFSEMLAAGSMKEEQREWFYGACRKLYGTSRDTELAFGVKNTAFFAMSLMYAASSLGLDTHPMDGFNHEGVMREFGIPAERYWIPLLMAVGYFRPGETRPEPKWRKAYEDIVVRFDTPSQG
ncbi:nitroreductase family protein [Desulfovibrio psychrotolerans]|uniref:Nitroreductase n=1 Tax=Desulfovibrio psychrotolerans TaxID=415242 RepID=A0A7J0BQ60_9BACT|nr:nitroreductase family protein [Desulfovibrio psychrotolerans]GFM35846.1 nitroreductase [Desulfovibrio psychrotolerans]